MAQEIERRWLVDKPKALFLIDAFMAEGHEYWQGYLSEPGSQNAIRIRSEAPTDPKKPIGYWLYIKSGFGMTREESKLSLEPGQFHDLKNMMIKANMGYLSKKRYTLPIFHTAKPGSQANNLIAELDIFDAPLEPLVIVEIEFTSEEEANTFDVKAYPWLGKEITKDKEYGNMSLAWKGLPKVL
jgi:adenylate cyclase